MHIHPPATDRVRMPQFALAATAVALPLPAAAGARTLYVSPNGADSKPCTKKAPCKTIRRALAKALGGATVKVARHLQGGGDDLAAG